jgi:hypothetical protein
MPESDSFKFVRCSHCNHPVDINFAKADHDGKAMHEECYLKSLQAKIEQNASRATRAQSSNRRPPGGSGSEGANGAA